MLVLFAALMLLAGAIELGVEYNENLRFVKKGTLYDPGDLHKA